MGFIAERRLRSLVRKDGASNELVVDNLQTLLGPSTVGTFQASRRKGTEKSCLDDIMGDPDDFRDLKCFVAESDWDRWEDTMKNGRQDIFDAEEPLQQQEVEPQDVLERNLKVSTCRDDIQPSLHVLHAGPQPTLLEEQGIPEQSCSEKQHQASDKESTCMQNGGTSNGSSTRKTRQKRYFIIKSLNHHNISKSIEKGIWATQTTNEPVLNEAFENAEVLLIFSVNMSGHFQGYAQMVSPIGQRRASVWSEANSGSNPWGGTFRVEWLQMHDLPFQKTVHLKNPMNSFKPVKISRDCQEVTQDIGEALCALIDEGATRECMTRRKISPGDASSAKRQCIEDLSLSNSGFYGPTVAAKPMKGPMTPFTYPATHFSPALLHEPYNAQMPMIRFSANRPTAISRLNKQSGSSSSRSPRSFSSGKGSSQERDRKKDSYEGRDAEFPPEEDLLNMTYEEYLRHFENPREFNQSHQGVGSLSSQQAATLHGAGWTSKSSLGMEYSADQYSKYLAKWYSNQQGLVQPKGGYYNDLAFANRYSGNQHM